jgi:hypothetical protein
MTHARARTGLTTVFFAGALWAGGAAHASAIPFGGHGNGSGNGSHNRNSFIINSPSDSRDFQHVRSVNAGGVTITPAAVCRRTGRHCRITQKVLFIDP